MAKKKISYEPQILDLILYAGDGSGFRVTVKDPANDEVNLTGTFLAQVRATRDAADPADAVFNVDTSEMANGVIVVYLTADQTEALVSGLDPGVNYLGVWDLEWTPTDSEPFTLCQGKVECLRDVSH
jgi:hypothetical protein